MNAVTKMSAKGQVVIPKDVREAMGWHQGTPLDIVRGATGIMLREVVAVGREPTMTLEDTLARIHAVLDYRGPVIDDAAIRESIGAMYAARADFDA